MPESFGVKFSTIFLNHVTHREPRIRKLIFWGKKLSLLGLTPTYDYGAAGNLSFRTKNGFIITASGKDIGKLTEEDFVEVRSCSLDYKEATVYGKLEPSSETMLHCAVYAKRPDVKVVFHVHDEYAINKCEELGLRCTSHEKPAGSKELVDEVLSVLGDQDYIVLKNHGIISLGSTTEEAGHRILEVNSKIKRE